MNSVTLSEAQRNLVELVHDLEGQGELLITDNDRPVARLSAVTSTTGRVSLRDLKSLAAR
jgi:antitoxin (DNA-binding transcriptional repressor) of toxin-antitoxin stability system